MDQKGKTQNPFSYKFWIFSLIVHIALFFLFSQEKEIHIPKTTTIELLAVEDLVEKPTPPTPSKPLVAPPQSPTKPIAKPAPAQTPISPPKQAPTTPQSEGLQKPETPISPQNTQTTAPTQNNIVPTTNTSPNSHPITNNPVSVDALDSKDFTPFGNLKPTYPSIAKQAGLEGWVEVKVRINEKGKVVQVIILKVQGHSSFGQAVESAAQQWRFPPPRSQGQKVEVWYIRKIAFRLTDTD